MAWQENFREEAFLKLKRIFIEGSIYLVTEEALSNGRKSEEVASKALSGGVKIIQLRDKGLSKRERLDKAFIIRKLTRESDALFFIDDDADIAQIVSADGVHLGLTDLPVSEVKKAFPKLLIGASTHSLFEAENAQREGADYVNIGPIYATTTKEWSDDFLGPGIIRQIQKNITIPFSVMGGIQSDNLAEVMAHGARLVAVATAITKADDIEQEAYTMNRKLRDILAKEKKEPTKF